MISQFSIRQTCSSSDAMAIKRSSPLDPAAQRSFHFNHQNRGTSRLSPANSENQTNKPLASEATTYHHQDEAMAGGRAAHAAPRNQQKSKDSFQSTQGRPILGRRY